MAKPAPKQVALPAAPAAREVLRPLQNARIDAAVADALDPVRLRAQATAAGIDIDGPLPATSSWIQLARSGTWRGHSAGEFEFNADVYQEIVSNFRMRNANGEVPLDFEHASEAGFEGSIAQEGAPAQGWIKELRYTDDMLEGRVEWVATQPGLGYVREKSYKYISPAVIFDSIDRVTAKPIGAELTSAALTNRPFLDGMRAVEAKHKVDSMAKPAAKKPVRANVESAKQMGEGSPSETDDSAQMVTNSIEKAPSAMVTNTVEKAPSAMDDDGEGAVEMVTNVTNTVTNAIETARCATAKMSDDEKAAAMVTNKQRSLVATMAAAKGDASLTATIEAVCAEICEHFGYFCWVVECFTDHAVFCGFGESHQLWSIDYKMDGTTAELIGEPVEVRRSYESVQASATMSATAANTASRETTHMSIEKIAKALGLSASATVEQCAEAIVSMSTRLSMFETVLGDQPEKRIKRFSAAVARDESVCTALSIGDTEDRDSAVVTKLTSVLAQAKKADTLEAENKVLLSFKSAVESEKAEAEVDWIIANGAHYKLAVAPQFKASLLSHRLAKPEEFAAAYKPALDGMKAGDKPQLFRQIVPHVPPFQAAPAQTADENDTAFNTAVDAEIAEATKLGVKLSRSDAMSAVHARMFRQATSN